MQYEEIDDTRHFAVGRRALDVHDGMTLGEVGLLLVGIGLFIAVLAYSGSL